MRNIIICIVILAFHFTPNLGAVGKDATEIRSQDKEEIMSRIYFLKGTIKSWGNAMRWLPDRVEG